MSERRIYQVDAFTDRAFYGNPAGVCVLDDAAPEEWMRQVAAEMNLSETAFLVAAADGFDLRWFTPEKEVDLCGHATLASAHVLWETERLPRTAPARFHTLSGTLTARSVGGAIEMDFPALPAAILDRDPGIAAALGVETEALGESRFDYLAEVADEAVLRRLRPDFQKIRKLGVRGVIVTTVGANDEIDFVSRYFAPAYGIDEDPVTGSAHCTLAPYWARRLGRDRLVGFQASQRGGRVEVRLEGDRVLLIGSAVTVLRGEILGP